MDFIGKSILIDDILVVGDLHFGYEESLRSQGYFVPRNIYEEVIRDFDEIFERVDVKKIIILGDLKHDFGRISRGEWSEVLDFIDYINDRCEEVVIIKGNHDILAESITKKKGILVKDYYIIGENAFLHGDRDFEEVNSGKIKRWFVGHAHPAITLEDGVKKEKFKCFLVGKFKGKEVIVLPSFFPVVEGTDPRDFDLGLAWKFDLGKFKVKVVGENLEVLDFGILKKIN